MKETRRNFLKFVGLSAAAGLCFSPAGALASGGAAGASGPVKSKKALSATRWAMVIDTRKVNTKEQIEKLEHACHKWHNVPNIEGKQEIKWLWGDHFHAVFTEKHNNFPSEEVTKREYVLLCNHCENPPCVRVCPTQATYKREDGIVAMDYHRCIGCRYCMAGCPYGARSFNFMDPRPFIHEPNMTFPTRMRGVVEKCNFCVDRLSVGLMPACVEESGGALTFGDLADENSEVRQILRENFTIRRKPSAGTEPGVYYII